MTSKAFRERDLVTAAARWLREHVPEAWIVDVATREDTSRSRRPDSSIEIRSPVLANRLSIDVRASLRPRDAERLLAGVGRRDPRLTRRTSVLVVAPWLSPRTRELLAEGGVNYVDLTGTPSSDSTPRRYSFRPRAHNAIRRRLHVGRRASVVRRRGASSEHSSTSVPHTGYMSSPKRPGSRQAMSHAFLLPSMRTRSSTAPNAAASRQSTSPHSSGAGLRAMSSSAQMRLRRSWRRAAPPKR